MIHWAQTKLIRIHHIIAMALRRENTSKHDILLAKQYLHKSRHIKISQVLTCSANSKNFSRAENIFDGNSALCEVSNMSCGDRYSRSNAQQYKSSEVPRWRSQETTAVKSLRFTGGTKWFFWSPTVKISDPEKQNTHYITIISARKHTTNTRSKTERSAEVIQPGIWPLWSRWDSLAHGGTKWFF